MTVAITRRELDAGGLRREAGRGRDARAARGMLALGLGLGGGSRGGAARAAGRARPPLGDWVPRYNAEGLAGLRDRRRPGPRPRLTPEQEAALAGVVERGPDPDRDGVVRWRRVDLKALIEARYGVALHERSVGKVLRRPRRRRRAARARVGRGAGRARLPPPVGAPETPEVGRGGAGGVQKGFADLVAAALPERAPGRPVEGWVQGGGRG